MRTDGNLTAMDPKVEYDKRFKSMEESDFGMFTKDDVNYDVINFENYNHYNVTITNRGRIKYSCDCPDFQRRCRYLGIPCKHVMFVQNNIEVYKKRSEECVKSVNEFFSKMINKEGNE